MRKKYLEKRMKRLQAKKESLKQRCDASTDAAEVRELTRCLEEVNEEIEDTQEELDVIESEEAAKAEAEERAAVPQNAQLVNGNVVGTFAEEKRESKDMLASIEYREAFMAFVQRGTKIPEKFEQRSPAVANTTKYSAAIPVTIMDEIIKDISDECGNIYNLCRKLNVQGGVKFPVADLNVEWHWLADGGVSDTQDAGTADAYVSFEYILGEARISETLLLNITKLSVFETEFAQLLAEAFLKAMDYGVINGSGSNQMTGILNDTRLTTDLASTNIIEMSVDEMDSWVDWKQKFIAKVPRKYRKNATFVFAGETVDAHLATLRDKNDRPLYVEAAGLTLDDSNEGRFLGKPVQIVDSTILDNIDDAEVGDYVGIFGDFSQYAINSNKEFVVDKWEDKNTNKVITRGLSVVDGKMLLPKAFFLIKKKAGTPTI